MRICFATYPAVMLLKGGPKTQLFQTKAELEKIGVQVELCEAWQEPDFTKYDLVHLFGANIATYHYARELNKLGVPMVVSPIFFSRHRAPVIKAALAVDTALRGTVQGVWMDYGFVRDICKWSKAVLPNTKRESKLLHDGIGVPNKKLFVVHNGVEARFEHADPSLFEKEYGLRNFVLNVGHVGMPRKNVFRLIQALEKINAPAVIIGRIENTPYGRKCMAEAKQNDRLLMLDSIPNASALLASAYAACDVFALPSQFETPGIAALEAGLAGAKIVITPNGGTEEYFGSHAEYVEPSSWELIHHGITTALNKPKNPELQEHIRGNYLWEHVGAKTLEVYNEVLA